MSRKIVDWKGEHARTYMDRGDYPEVITPDHGIGVTFKDDKGIEYTTVAPKETRQIDVDVTTYTGFCIGAIHYYAKIKVGEASLSFTDEHGQPCRYSIGGYFDRFKPEIVKDIHIEVQRFLNEYELKDVDSEDARFHGCHEESLVNAYEDQIELYNDIVSCIKARFAGEWVVNIQGFDDSTLNCWEANIADLNEK